jgi:speckle-type POZ protein
MDKSTGRFQSLFGDPGDKPRRYAVFSTFPTKLPLPPHHPPRCWGVPSWREFNLEEPTYIENDSLTIRCDMSVIMPLRVPETKTLTQIQAPPRSLPMDIRGILETKDGKDVTVLVRGEAFPVHRTVLAARSPVIKQKLLDATTDEAGPPPSVEISMDDDMDPEVFKALLHFIYTDELPPDAKVRDDGADETVEFVRRLFIAAEGYGIERLKGICESLLCRDLSKRTLKATKEFAVRHRCDKLRAACVEFHAACHHPGPVVCNQYH